MRMSAAVIVAKSTFCASLCGIQAVRSSTLLNHSTAHRVIRDDSALDEQIAAAPAAGPHPFLIESQHVGVGREGTPFTDLAEHVDARRKFAGEFVEHVTERGIAAPSERSIRALSQLDVVIHVDQAAREAVSEETGDEQRQVADFAEAVALAAPARLQGMG